MVNEEQQPTGGPATTETTPTADGASTTGQTKRARATAAKPPTAPQAAAAGAQPLRRRHRRPEMIQKRREERYRQYERQKRQWFYTRIGLAAVAVLVVGAVAYVVFTWVQGRIDEQALDDVQVYNYSNSENHVDVPPTYAEVPPVGGPHNAIFQNCGFYEAPIQDWHAVHSLEHGAVWITYQPDLPQDQIDELRELAEETSYVLVSPYPDLPAPVVLSAWNRQLQLDSVDERGFDAFIRQYRRNPDAAPEPNGPCVGGTSATAA